MNLVPTSASIPGRLRIADIDHDGFPDVIATVVNGKKSKTHLFENVAENSSEGSRTLSLSQSISEVTDIASDQA